MAEQTVTAPGKAEFKDKYYDYEGETYGATVEIKDAEEARVRFWAGKVYHEKEIELSNGRGTVNWQSEFEFGLQVVIRPFSA